MLVLERRPLPYLVSKLVRRNIPRYQVIAQKLLRAIETGQLAVGASLITEEKLGEKFKASRGTIRQSLAVLEDAGLILRRQRSGTRVLSKFPAHGLLNGDQILEDWARYGTEYPLRISSVERRTLPAEILSLAPNISRGRWLVVTGLRYPIGSRTPIAYTQAFVHPNYAAVGSDLSPVPVPLFALIEQRYGRVIEIVHAELRSLALVPQMAAALGATPHEPALQIMRLFMDSRRRVVEIAINTHPAGLYIYKVEIVRR
jgi:DNA-binding GntR family transcriptional regulator